MKVYTLLKQLKDPCKLLLVYGKGGSFLYKGVLNNVSWHIASCSKSYNSHFASNATKPLSFRCVR